MSDDVTAVPDAEAEREALAWVQEHPWVLTGERITDETAVDHVVAIVRAALARDLPAPTEEPFGVTHLRAAVLTALIDAGHQVRDADVDEIVTRTTRLLGDGWDRLFRAVWSDVSDRAGTAPTDGPPAGDCRCVPCTTPGRGHPGIEHCAACCGGSLIEEYDHACPDAEHRVMAARQFPPLPVDRAGDDEPPTDAGFDRLRADVASCRGGGVTAGQDEPRDEGRERDLYRAIQYARDLEGGMDPEVAWNRARPPAVDTAAPDREALASTILDSFATHDGALSGVSWMSLAQHAADAVIREDLAAAPHDDPVHATVDGVELRHRAGGSLGIAGVSDEYRSGPVEAKVPTSFSFGEYLVDELSARGIPRRMLTKPLGLTEPEIDDLIGGHRELTNDLAGRLGAFLGTSTRLWLNLDASHRSAS